MFKINDLIYILRYYEKIPYKQSNIKQLEKINKELEYIEKLLIEKACIQKILLRFSNNDLLNYNILSQIFESNIINLEKGRASPAHTKKDVK